MPDQPQAVPPGGQHGPSQILRVESFEDAEDVAPLSAQGPKKHPDLTSRTPVAQILRHNNPGSINPRDRAGSSQSIGDM
jgi:autonomous glycyl radical cofactor GrcA